MKRTRLTDTLAVSLALLGSFNALSAIAGGIAILATDGLGMPISMLSGSPFTSFLWPAVILIAVVGGTQVTAVVLVVARRAEALAASAVAGFGMVIWIFVETGIIRGLSWLQIVYFATGVLQLALVIVLSGALSWLPSCRWARRCLVVDRREGADEETRRRPATVGETPFRSGVFPCAPTEEASR
ncbi:hypothetical protein ELQ92_14870 [Labedella populi]|uniref:Uncharacterized protein n=1 Tax=Labedella populi TaxID=2498850 RepID=A0A3S4AXL7_9MICO|nr:hypothetical protein [Labedella populi]RWZ58303.1 hypothetical protein ELQ92_14870 [Labedella populi]